jgi:hypothetical protein
MTLTCPNDSNHVLFNQSVWALQTWTVNEHGDLLEIIPDDTRQPEDGYTCAACGIEAKVEK